jgi:hypothetical protein
MYIVIVTGHKIQTGEVKTTSIYSQIALEKSDIQQRMLDMGWIVLAVYCEKIAEPHEALV